MGNVKNIKAPFIVEIANAPITKEAAETLINKNTIILPDILANAGGVIVSYFEWVQSKMGYYWTKDKVDKKLKELLSDAFKASWLLIKDSTMPFRQACYVLALQRIDRALESHGSKKFDAF